MPTFSPCRISTMTLCGSMFETTGTIDLYQFTKDIPMGVIVIIDYYLRQGTNYKQIHRTPSETILTTHENVTRRLGFSNSAAMRIISPDGPIGLKIFSNGAIHATGVKSQAQIEWLFTWIATLS